jgi:nitronate monooxygenase
MNWRDRRLLGLFGIEHPIVQAPMAGISSPQMALAVAQAGGLGSIAAAMLTPDALRSEMQLVQQATDRPINVNFFVHVPPRADAASEVAWRRRLEGYYREFGLSPEAAVGGPARAPFDAAMCDIVLEYRPKVVSFHFGIPEATLVDRLKQAGILVISSATTVEEARFLEAKGCDAIVAQGNEAGGHRGMFLTDDVTSQPGTMALVPQVVDAVKVPVIAAGGIGDGRGIAAALALGAAGVQIGTAFMLSPEAKTPPLHREALAAARDDNTVLTNVFTGRPARGIVNRYVREVGPISAEAPAFPLASGASQPLRIATEPKGSSDFMPLWSGQAPTLARAMLSAALLAAWVEETKVVFDRLG